MESIYIFYILLFIVAFLYSSVGHGGASGYLALMAIYAISPEVMKPSALLLNLFVSITSFYQFYRGKHFKWHIFLPLAIASVPMAFLGGLISIEADFYKKFLGFLLLIPVIRFLFFANFKTEEIKKNNIVLSILILAGHLSKGIHFSPDMIFYVAIAFAGGLCGSYFGSLKFNQNILKNTLAIVLLLAGIKLIFT